MPWNPVKKFPEVIRELRASGYTKEVNFENLKIRVIEVLGVVRDDSISRLISTMQSLGYIKMKPDGVTWEIFQEKRYNFASSGQNEKDVSDMIDKHSKGKPDD